MPSNATTPSRYLATHGYVLVHAPGHPLANANGYVYEHPDLAYEVYGPFPHDAVVHHRDGDKSNNTPANLQVLTRSEHMRLHMEHNTLAARPPLDAWSLRFAHCQDCGTTLRRHVARGLCALCYDRDWNRRNPGPGRARGMRVSGAKLTDEQVRAIFKRVHFGESCASLAREYGVRAQTISSIKLRKKWRHVTGA